MTYFAIAILLGAAIYLLFRFVGAQNHHLFTVVLINYPVCVVVGIVHLLLKTEQLVSHKSIFIASLSMGLLFISMFYLMGKLTRQSGVAVSSVVSRVSLVIPTLFFFFFWDEPLGAYTILGVGLAIISIVLVSEPKKGVKRLIGVLPLVVFIGYGLVDVGLKLSQNVIKDQMNARHELTLGIFLFAGIYGWLLKFIKGIKLYKRSIIPGIVLGVINYYSIYFFILALEHLTLASTVIFPINGIGIMLVATIGSVLFFKEKLNLKKTVALVLAAIAILLLSN